VFDDTRPNARAKEEQEERGIPRCGQGFWPRRCIGGKKKRPQRQKPGCSCKASTLTQCGESVPSSSGRRRDGEVTAIVSMSSRAASGSGGQTVVVAAESFDWPMCVVVPDRSVAPTCVAMFRRRPESGFEVMHERTSWSQIAGSGRPREPRSALSTDNLPSPIPSTPTT
jgi:hypothetical protein